MDDTDVKMCKSEHKRKYIYENTNCVDLHVLRPSAVLFSFLFFIFNNLKLLDNNYLFLMLNHIIIYFPYINYDGVNERQHFFKANFSSAPTRIRIK